MFGRKQSKTKTLEQYADTVEEILSTLNIDPTELHADAGFGWSFRRGSAVIEIYISEDKGRGYLQVLSPILVMPENGLLALYRRLLEYNLQLTNASLGVFHDVAHKRIASPRYDQVDIVIHFQQFSHIRPGFQQTYPPCGYATTHTGRLDDVGQYSVGLSGLTTTLQQYGISAFET